MQRLGLSGGTTLYDVNLNDYMSQTQFNPDKINVNDPEQIKRYNALRKLSGQDQLGGGLFSEADVANAGTWNPAQYNHQGLQDALSAAKKKYERDNIIDLIAQLYPGDWTGAKMNSTANPLSNIQSQLPGGTGMRARRYNQDGYARQDANIAAMFNKDPNDPKSEDTLSYENLINAIDNAWGKGVVQDQTARFGGKYAPIFEYQKKLNEVRKRVIGNQLSDKAVTPAPDTGGLKIYTKGSS